MPSLLAGMFYSMEVTPVMPPSPLPDYVSSSVLVPSGNDELYLVETIFPRTIVLDFGRLKCRVSRLDEETGQWVEVSDLGDRVLFIGQPGNVSCSAKELPDGCGVSGNSILITHGRINITYLFKYGVDTGHEEDDLNFWRFSRENLVTFLILSPVVAFQKIPIAFFLKHMDRKYEQNTAELRSDASKITWKVKLEDDQKKLTDGWKEFALAHDL